ncbi:hypothetical protein [Marmoricola sp. RAF53]|uniref:hypothetical protein n=1 Tax=Marmoricola sp. RAF53 TaxID=3233059 RepID=UPI003F95EF7E
MTDEPEPFDYIARMNEFYYSQPPMDVLQDRLILLALRATKAEQLGELTTDLEWGELRLQQRRPGDSPRDLAEEERAKTAYIMTESQNLFHHAGETLVRLFLAHRHGYQCPWLEAASFQRPGAFRDELDALARPVWTQDQIDDVAFVFFGGSRPDPDEKWLEARDQAVRFLRMVAQRLHADKNLYNATKHGLTAIGTEVSMTLAAEGSEPILGADGTSVIFIERGAYGTKDADKWFETTQWINPHQVVFFTQLVIDQIAALWQVARMHHLGADPGTVVIANDQAMDKVVSGFPRKGPMTSMRKLIAVENRPEKNGGKGS